MRTVIAISLTLATFVHAETEILPTKVISFDSPSSQSKEALSSSWNEIPSDKRRKIENYLMTSLGLSSTGKIHLIGVYRHPRKEYESKKRENILHFQQLDLMGTRLFWSVLIDSEASTAWVLYHPDKKPVTGKPIAITNNQ